uniref:ATP-binding cassette sub-family B member 8, mitochondrial n=1 Tax=Timema cristinae TaxID=61476 RepID=A0A7R9CSJ9_TIMCR|nr:unnamed protein product [Timema cristinae]
MFNPTLVVVELGAYFLTADVVPFIHKTSNSQTTRRKKCYQQEMMVNVHVKVLDKQNTDCFEECYVLSPIVNIVTRVVIHRGSLRPPLPANVLFLLSRSKMLWTVPRLCRGYLGSQWRFGSTAAPCRLLQGKFRVSLRGPTPQRWLVVALGAAGLGLSSNFAMCQPSRVVGLSPKEEQKDPSFDWSKFLELLRPHIWWLLAAVVGAFIVALLNVEIPRILGSVVNVVAQCIRDEGAPHFLEKIRGPAVRLLLLYVAQAGFTFVYIYLLSNVGERVATRMKQDLFSSILRQDVSFFDQQRTGELVNRLTADIQDFKSSFKSVISQGLRSVTQASVRVRGVFVLYLARDGGGHAHVGTHCRPIGDSHWLIAQKIVEGGPGPVVAGSVQCNNMLITLVWLVKRETKLFTTCTSHTVGACACPQSARATALGEEAISNIRTVRACAMEGHERQLFAAETDKASRLNQRLGLGIGLFQVRLGPHIQAGTNLFLNSLVLGTLYMGGQLMSSSRVSPGDLMSFLAAIQVIQRSLGQLSLLLGQTVRGLGAGARVFQFTNLEPSIPLSGGFTIPQHTLLAGVEFTDVTFSYPTRSDQERLLQWWERLGMGSPQLLLSLKGESHSLVVEDYYFARSPKSPGFVLVRTVWFYDVNEGSITLDGVDIRQLDPSWLRGRVIGYMDQEPALFATTVMENIRYGRPDATDEEVMRAAMRAHAHDFIVGFPAGYSTLVGERGASLSGGQRQRIAIARAILKDPAILILDEATSALDAESEHIVQGALDTLMQGRTVLVIAHRLSSVRRADIIMVLNAGIIVEVT